MRSKASFMLAAGLILILMIVSLFNNINLLLVWITLFFMLTLFSKVYWIYLVILKCCSDSVNLRCQGSPFCLTLNSYGLPLFTGSLGFRVTFLITLFNIAAPILQGHQHFSLEIHSNLLSLFYWVTWILFISVL